MLEGCDMSGSSMIWVGKNVVTCKRNNNQEKSDMAWVGSAGSRVHHMACVVVCHGLISHKCHITWAGL